MDSTKEYKVFISYSWTSEKHEKWVLDLATRLMENGIEAKFDKWDLKAGDDKYAFMEASVTDQSINNVLIICDKGYKEKADSRESGVGTETQIITPEIYNKTQQNKFIPIIAEKGETGESYLPQYLKSRIYIDLSSEEVYEANYEQLIRLITDRPTYRKPAKGELPSYLFEDEKPHNYTQNINKQIEYAFEHNPKRINYLSLEFFNKFIEYIENFKLNYSDMTEPYDEVIYNSILNTIELRNDYIKFLSILCINKTIDIDKVINMFEKLYKYTKFNGSGSFNRLQFDNIKFLIQELFIYTTVMLIDYDLYEELNIILSSKFFVDTDIYSQKSILYPDFRFYIESLDVFRKQRLNSDKISITADLLIERSTIENKSYKEKVLEADLLLHYLSTIKYGETYAWFPTTYIYAEHYTMKIFNKLESKRYFEKVKILFGVNNEEEMKLLISSYKNAYRGYSHSFSSIPSISKYIDINDICKFA